MKAYKYVPLIILPFASSTYADQLNSSIGITGIWAESYIVGEDNVSDPFPYVNLSYGMFRASPQGIGVEHTISDKDKVSLLVKLRRSPLDIDENSQLTGLNERKDATELALGWSTKLQSIDITSSLAADISDKHNGYEAKIKASKPYKTQVGLFIPSLGLAYQSKDLVNYYHGISASESALSGYQAYKGDGGVIGQMGITHIFPISDHWKTITNIQHTTLGDNISDSPIVEQSSFWAGMFSVVYTF